MQKLIARFLTPLLENTGNETLRRAIVTRHIALAGVVLGGSYAVLNAVMDIWIGALANLGFALIWLFIAQLCQRDHINKSRHLMLVATNLHLLLTALFVFGKDCGGHHYLLASATVGAFAPEAHSLISNAFWGLVFPVHARRPLAVRYQSAPAGDRSS